VEERLAACGPNIASIRSIYRWEGAVQDDPEARVALHTRTALVPELVERVKALHSYDVPCVIALPVAAGPGSELLDPSIRGSLYGDPWDSQTQVEPSSVYLS
jgi:uncharacterized protein involved in tolerance to divalent cations